LRLHLHKCSGLDRRPRWTFSRFAFLRSAAIIITLWQSFP
jgi:hypothetical protein